MSRADHTDHGLAHVANRYSVPDTMGRLETLAKSRGLTIFARIDFSGDAQKVGLTMRPSQLLIFGNPKAGTPLMIASPSIAIDLPLKVLVWEGADGKVWISYNAPAYLQARHGLPPELVQNIAVVEALAAKAAE